MEIEIIEELFPEAKKKIYKNPEGSYPNLVTVIANPAVVIGCGGTGFELLVALVRKLHEHMVEIGSMEHASKKIPSSIKFLYLDTDANEWNKMNEGHEEITQHITFLHLQLKVTVTNDECRKFAEGFKENNKVPQTIEKSIKGRVAGGAGMDRWIGRAYIWSNWEKVRNGIKGAIDSALEGFNEGNPIISFYILGSICGGTGSGTFIDVAALIRDVQHEIFRNRPEISNWTWYINAILIGPEIIRKTQNLNLEEHTLSLIRANTYSALKEINHFLTGNTFSASYPHHPTPKEIKISQQNANELLFNHIYFLNEVENLDAVKEKVGDFLTFMLISNVGRDVESRLCNMWTNRSGAGYAEINGKKVCNIFAKFNVATAIIPVHHLLRFLYWKMCRRFWNEFYGKGVLAKIREQIGSLEEISIDSEKVLDDLLNRLESYLNDLSHPGELQWSLNEIKKRFEPIISDLEKKIKKMWDDYWQTRCKNYKKRGLDDITNEIGGEGLAINKHINENKITELINVVIKGESSEFFKEDFIYKLLLFIKTLKYFKKRCNECKEKEKNEHSNFTDKIGKLNDKKWFKKGKGYRNFLWFIYSLLPFGKNKADEIGNVNKLIDEILNHIEEIIKNKFYSSIFDKIYPRFCQEIVEKEVKELGTLLSVDYEFKNKYVKAVEEILNKELKYRFFFPRKERGYFQLKEEVFERLFYEKIRDEFIRDIQKRVGEITKEQKNELLGQMIEEKVKTWFNDNKGLQNNRLQGMIDSTVTSLIKEEKIYVDKEARQANDKSKMINLKECLQRFEDKINTSQDEYIYLIADERWRDVFSTRESNVQSKLSFVISMVGIRFFIDLIDAVTYDILKNYYKKDHDEIMNQRYLYLFPHTRNAEDIF